MAAANALLLGALLDRGLEIDFFSKPSFVDPRPAAGSRPGFRFIPATNRVSDSFRQVVEKYPLIGPLACRNDAFNYNRLLIRRIREEHAVRPYDAVLWMGDYAHGAVPGIPTISFAQGPPGTDARSVLRRRSEIRRLAGRGAAIKWTLLAQLRLSRLGLPRFEHSDHIIVGSKVSLHALVRNYGVPVGNLSTLPYPIDLDLFEPGRKEESNNGESLRLLWLGRIVPRKRLDLFLDGTAAAIRQGLDVKVTIVGRVGFVKGYEKLIREFPYPARLRWVESIARGEVPDMLRDHHVLAQPSEDEDFGSSVAEAQACGLPVIVGRTSGNADYLCPGDIHLDDDGAETFARALRGIADRRRTQGEKTSAVALQAIEEMFGIESVGERLATLVDALSFACRQRVMGTSGRR